MEKIEQRAGFSNSNAESSDWKISERERGSSNEQNNDVALVRSTPVERHESDDCTAPKDLHFSPGKKCFVV